MFGLRRPPSFDIRTESPSETLLCGFSEFGLAGLTTANYLVDRLDLEQVGHIEVDQFPPIAPFENGTPRRHTRLFSRPGVDLTVLVGELFVPPGAATAFGNAIVDWAERRAVEEVVVASGVPIAHGPEDHRAFYVADEAYQAAHLTDAGAEDGPDLAPMAGGFLDGVNGAIVSRGLGTDLRTAVITTPAHAQAPDVEAALRLVDALDDIYGLGVDTAPLEGFAAEVSSYYAELAERMEETAEEESFPDRMYN
jgi:uncharacterized protein